MDKHEYGYMRDYVHGDKGPMGIRILVKTIVFSLVFSVAFLGVPLPHPFNTYIEKAPKPVQMAIDALRIPEACASQIKRVQKGQITVGPTALGSIVKIEEVDITKSFVVISVDSASGADAFDGLFGAEFYDSTHIYVTRQDTKGDFGAIIWYYVVEFVGDVNAQSGFAVLPGGQSTRSINLPSSVDLTKSFILTYPSGLKTKEAGEGHLTAKFVDSSTISFKRGFRKESVFVNWQVVEFTKDVKVRSGSATIGDSSTSTTTLTMQTGSDLTTDPIDDLAKSFLIVTSTTQSTVKGQDYNILMTKGTITNTTTLTFTREITGFAIDIEWFLVEIEDDSTDVQKGSETLGAGTASWTSKDMSGRDLTRMFPLQSQEGGADGEKISGEHTIALKLTNPTSYDTYDFTDAEATAAYEGTVTTDPPIANNLPSTTDITSDTDLDLNNATFQLYSESSTGNAAQRFIFDITGTGYAAMDEMTVFWNGVGTSSDKEAKGCSMYIWNWDLSQYDTVQSTDIGDETDFQGTYSVFSEYVEGTTEEVILLVTGMDTGATAKLHSISTDYVKVVFGYVTDYDTAAFLGERTLTTENMKIDWFLPEFGPLTITAPAAGAVWSVGATNDITWQHADSLEAGGSHASGAHEVDLEFSINSGSTWETTAIATGLAADADTYAWQTPANLGTTGIMTTQALIKITDTDLSTNNYDISDGDFEVRGSMDVTAPDGGELWYIGDTTRNIVWDFTGDIGTVDLYYRTSAGSSWNSIEPDYSSALDDSYGGTESYNWTPIPDLVYTTMQVKVESTTDPDYTQVSDFSAEAFEIRPKLWITAPEASDQFPLGQTNQITWGATGSIDYVDLYYSINTGVDWTSITTDEDASSGSYDWTVPVGIQTSADCRVRIEKSDNANLVGYGPDADLDGVADGVFELLASLEITAPAGGATWKVGEANSITWNYFPEAGITNIKLSYQVDGGTWIGITTKSVGSGGTGSHSWTVEDAISDAAKIRIEEAPSSATIYDESEAFYIKGRIVVSEPHSGEVLSSDTTKVIQWDAYGDLDNTSGNVDIALSYDGGGSYPETITTNKAPSGETFSWDIPSDVTQGSNCMIKVFDPDDPLPPPDDGVAGESAVFELKGDTDLTVPNGGETYYVGETIPITWVPSPPGLAGTLQIQYSTDSGTTGSWVDLDTVAASAGSYPWVVGSTDDVLGATNRIKIKMIGDESSVNDESVGNFTIKGSLDLTAPDGGQTWSIGTTNSITWTRGNIYQGDIDILYSVDSGTSFTGTVTENLDSGSSPFLWNIPTDVITGDKNTEMRVMVVDALDSVINDESSTDFTVKGRLITLTSSPLGANGGGTFEVGQALNITWTTQGDIGNVDLLYSTNSGTSYDFTLISNTPNASGYELSNLPTPGVPDAIGDEVRFLVRSNAAPDDIQLEAGGICEIKGSITIANPSGSNVDDQSLIATDPYTITWAKQGNIGDVKVQYSSNNGSDWSTLGTVPSTDLSYPWASVPDEIDTDNKIRVEDDDDSTVYDESAAFEIMGELILSVGSPGEASGEFYYIGGASDPLDIDWTSKGTIGDCKIWYSVDDGSSYVSTVVETVSYSAGTHSWPLDAITPGPDFKVRIESKTNSSYVYDESVFKFGIRGSVYLDIPNGGEAGWKVNKDPNTITWHTTGAMDNIGLYYSIDNGSDNYPYTIITSTAASAGSYPWTIDSGDYSTYTSDNARIKIVDAADANNVWDVGDASFDMEPDLVLTVPDDGSQIWRVDNPTAYDIEWTYDGNVSSVKIEFSDDGGSTWPGTGDYLISNSYSAASLSFPWTPPDKISNDCKVRITDTSDSDVTDESQFYFKIKGSITVTDPDDGNESWSSGSTQDITWNKTGSIGTVKIEYSPDGGSGVAYSQITDATGINSVDGTWEWVIADTTVLGTEAKVKIIDEDDSTVYDESDNGFQVKGGLTLLTPSNTGIELGHDGTSTYNITWQRFGAINNVELRYSINNGTTYPYQIVASTSASAELYDQWVVPDQIQAGNQLMVKVIDADDDTVFDESDNPFMVYGQLVLDTPNANETWYVGTAGDIQWTPTGTWDYVDIYYSTDNGSNWTIVPGGDDVSAGTSTQQQTFNTWAPGINLISSQYKVKIEDADATRSANVVDESTGTSRIVGSVTVTGPNGTGIVWYKGETTREIAWTATGDIDPVKIDYSVDSGSNWTEITATAPGGDGPQTYTWAAVADEKDEECRIRVSDPSFLTYTNDMSDNDFAIRPQLTVSQPVADTDYAVGDTTNIRINRTSSKVTNVSLEYSTNNGSDWTAVSGGSNVALTGDDTDFTWTIPNTISHQVKVKATDTGNSNVDDISDGVFRIVGGIVISAPADGVKWQVNPKDKQIAFTTTGDIANVKIEYSANAGSTWTDVISPKACGSAGAYTHDWTTMPDATTLQGRIRISDYDSEYTDDITDVTGDFSLIGRFEITHPEDGDVAIAEDSYLIEWTPYGTGISTIVLQYSTDGGSDYTTITGLASNANDGAETWPAVPGTTLASTCKIRIYDPNVFDAGNADTYNVSNPNFEIRGEITVTAPNGTEDWDVGTTENITWTKKGNMGTLSIYYSDDSGSTYGSALVSDADSTAGSWTWDITESITCVPTGRVMIELNGKTVVNDESNADFTVRGSVALTSPGMADNEVYQHDGAIEHAITWTKFGAVTNVNLYYSSNSGTSWTLINGTPEPAGNGATGYNWLIPNTIVGKEMLVKVEDDDNNEVFYESDYTFDIKGTLVLDTPNNNETWYVGTAGDIQWTPTGTWDYIDIYYSTDNGSNWTIVPGGDDVPTGTTGEQQTFNTWAPGINIMSSQYKIKINDADSRRETWVVDESTGTNRILGSVTVTGPNGTGIVWYKGETTREVAWTATGNIDPVKIDYSVDGGSNWTEITASAPGGDGAQTYTWAEVADVKSETCRIRVSDPAFAITYCNDISDNDFAIRPQLTVSQPVADTDYTVGATTNIRINRTSTTIANVDIYYSTNNGSDWTQITAGGADNLPLTGDDTDYTWTIPNAISHQVKVKAEDVQETDINDDSDGVFRIVGGIVISAPADGAKWQV
ncbi:hypothetical protein ACFL2J_02785, partial [Candidatus Omnitrophota bacterium]